MTTDANALIVEEIPHLNRYARSLTRDAEDAADLVQEALERGLSKIDQFNPETSMRRWLFTIMRNLFIDKCRKTSRRGVHMPIDGDHMEPSCPPQQEDYIALREVSQRIGRLRDCDRQILKMSVFDGKKYDAIAADLGIAVGTVKSRLSRTRVTLAA